MERENFQKEILSIGSEQDFNACALALFQYQYQRNEVYRAYVDSLNIKPEGVEEYRQIPCLPVSVYKNRRVSCVSEHDFNKAPRAQVFKSSGTTEQLRSVHWVYDVKWYEQISMSSFTAFFGPIQDHVIVACLPSYYENKESSLLHMVDFFIRESGDELSGYYDVVKEDMNALLEACKAKGKKAWIIGVPYALLDWAELNKKITSPENVILIETGGMKGKRPEFIRKALHEQLIEGLGLPKIHSEYGMCELLSQAYCFDNEEFNSSPWLRFSIRELNDPLRLLSEGVGLIRVYDLANIDSCAFLETQDMGSINVLGHLKIWGRIDHSDIRGCNLLYENEA